MLNGPDMNAALQTDGRVVGTEATRTKSSTRRDVITAERLNRRCRRPPLKECSSPFVLSSSLPLTFLAFSLLAFVFGGCGAEEEEAVIKIRGAQSHRSDSGKDLAGISTGGERIKNVSFHMTTIAIVMEELCRQCSNFMEINVFLFFRLG